MAYNKKTSAGKSGYTSVTKNWTKSDKAGASVPSECSSYVTGSDLKGGTKSTMPKGASSASLGKAHAGPGMGEPSTAKRKYGK